jgi:DNA polymerase-3 subunit delta
MDVNQFKKEIASSNRKPFYLILGEDPEAREEAVIAAREAVNKDFFEFNYQNFSTDDVPFSQIIEAASTTPFFTPPRVVLVTRENYPDADLEKLANYLEKPNSDNVIALFVSEIKNDKRKVFQTALDKNQWVNCQAPSPAELPDWLVKRAAGKGTNLTRDGARTLLERLGGDNLSQLLDELDKMSLYPGPDVAIGPREVAELVNLGPTAVVYELSEPMALRDVGQAIKILLDLEEKSPPLSLSRAICNQFMSLLKFKASLDSLPPEHKSPAVALGLKPFRFLKLKDQAAGWTYGQMAKALKSILLAQRSLVTAPTPPAVVIEALALKLSLITPGQNDLDD